MSRHSKRSAVPQMPGEPVADTRGAGLDLDSIGDTGSQPVQAGEEYEDDLGGDQPQNTESDVDEAIALAQSGQARPIIKPRAPAPVASFHRPDPGRPPNAAVNQAPSMSYADAMTAVEAGTLQRSVLTERGWVAVQKAPPPETKR